MSDFSPESVSAVAKAANAVPCAPAHAATPRRHRATVAQRGSPAVEYSPKMPAIIGQSSTTAELEPRMTQTKKQSLPQASSKFDHIFKWTAFPASVKVSAQASQLSQQAAVFFRKIDKDGSASLSSVEFYEGMVSSDLGLSRDHILHIMNIFKSKQRGYYSLEEFEKIFVALQSPQHIASQQPSKSDSAESDEDIRIIADGPASVWHHPNPKALTQQNAGTF
jgi:Ca2+-binding EF-hand superfamily protein